MPEHWTLNAPVQTQHAFSHGTATADGRFVVACGCNDFPKSASTIVEAFMPTADAWQRLQDVPAEKRQNAPLVPLPNGKLLLIGGSSMQNNAVLRRLADCWLLDPTTGAWAPTGQTPSGTANEGKYCYALLGGKVVYFPGAIEGEGRPRSRTPYVYDLSAGRWDHLRTAGGDIA